MTLQDHGKAGADETGVSRRTVLGASLFSVGLLGAALLGDAASVAAVASAGTRPSQPPEGAAPVRVLGPGRLLDTFAVTTTRDTSGHPSSQKITQTATRTAARPVVAEPPWMHTWANPIRRLDSYTAHRLETRFPRRAIMLTIDDGPHPVWTPRYLRLLAKHHVTATFNVIGMQVHDNAKLVKAAADEGHHLGNHTFHHPLDLPYLSAATIRRELVDTTDAIVRASGFRPRQFRAPGGVWGPDVFAEVSRQQMMPLGWDIDPRDWALPGVDQIRRAMLAARPHDIILCHDGGGNRSETYRALEKVIPVLLARGWQFVTLPAPNNGRWRRRQS